MRRNRRSEASPPRDFSLDSTSDTRTHTSPGMSLEVVEVTPEIAGDYLSHSVANRPLREGTVRRYANLMKLDHWRLNGETIKFTSRGKLLDGQHRLTAVIVSGKTVRMAVLRGVAEDGFITLDQGAKRSLRDYLAIAGEANQTQLSATIAWYWKYIHTRLTAKADKDGWPTVEEGLALLSEHPGLRDAVRIVTGKLGHTLGARTPLTVAWYVLESIDAADRNVFFEDLRTGAGLSEDDPAFRLRERLLKNRLSKYKMSSVETLALIFKAWNAWRYDRPVKQLVWHHRGENQEDFPQPV